MKLMSRTLAVVLTTTGVIGTVGGAITFGVAGTGGLYPTIRIMNDSTTIGSPMWIYPNVGWLTYDVPLLFGAFIDAIFNNMEGVDIKVENFSSFIEMCRVGHDYIQTRIKKENDRIKYNEELIKQIEVDTQTKLNQLPPNASEADKKNIIESANNKISISNNSIIETKAVINNALLSILNAPMMYDLAIAGVVIMSVGIALSALSAFVAIKLGNHEKTNIVEENTTINS